MDYQFDKLVITQKFLRRRESGLLDEGAPQILRWAQDDSLSPVILSTAKDLTAFGVSS